MISSRDPAHAGQPPLEGLPCPTCGSHDLAPLLQCDYYPDGCLWLARCRLCGARYHFDLRPRVSSAE